jgi:hypothetical protein
MAATYTSAEIEIEDRRRRSEPFSSSDLAGVLCCPA